MQTAPHPLVKVAKLADTDGRFAFRLIVEQDGKLVRLACSDPNIWVMRALENGSMKDRWAHDGGAQFICLSDAQIEKGALSIWRDIAELAERKSSDAPRHPFFALYDEARAKGLGTFEILDMPAHNYTALVVSEPQVLFRLSTDQGTNIDRIRFSYHDRIELTPQDMAKPVFSQLRIVQAHLDAIRAYQSKRTHSNTRRNGASTPTDKDTRS
jgi:hypothetical protein